MTRLPTAGALRLIFFRRGWRAGWCAFRWARFARWTVDGGCPHMDLAWTKSELASVAS